MLVLHSMQVRLLTQPASATRVHVPILGRVACQVWVWAGCMAAWVGTRSSQQVKAQQVQRGEAIRVLPVSLLRCMLQCNKLLAT